MLRHAMIYTAGSIDHKPILQRRSSLLTISSQYHAVSAQRVPEPDPLPGISFDTRPDPIQF